MTSPIASIVPLNFGGNQSLCLARLEICQRAAGASYRRARLSRSCLRFHRGINAVIGLVTDPITNEPIGVHRTFLNGTKRERKMLGASRRDPSLTR
jgi:hypothetical protein